MRWPAPEERNWLFLRAPGTQSNLEQVPTSGTPPNRARIELPLSEYGSEGVVVGLDLGVRIEPVTPASWHRFLLDRTGRIRYVATGYPHEGPALSKVVETLLEEAPPAANP